MTTIAWDGKTLAADTLITENGKRVGRCEKIGNVGGVLFGVSGGVEWLAAFRGWFLGGMSGDRPAMKSGDNIAQAIVIHDGRVLSLVPDGWDVMKAPYYAVGSGCDLALGAMALGHTAEEAVRAACMIDVYSGGEITVLRPA